jgi:hypothetical protein
MADAIRRAHARFPCSRPVEVLLGAAAGTRLGTGILLDVSLAGGFMRFVGEMRVATPYRLRIESPDGAFEVPCRVVRLGPRGAPDAPQARHYGLTFNPTSDQESLLRRFLDVVRREPPPMETPFDRALRDYWSNTK